MDWNNDMDAAPKDGSPVDLWLQPLSDRDNPFRLAGCSWGRSAWANSPAEAQWVFSSRDMDEAWRDILHDVAYVYDNYTVTHWMRVDPPK